jgi:hypothetical protein
VQWGHLGSLEQRGIGGGKVGVPKALKQQRFISLSSQLLWQRAVVAVGLGASGAASPSILDYGWSRAPRFQAALPPFPDERAAPMSRRVGLLRPLRP